MLQGRYGNDHLNKALGIAGMVLMVLSMIFRMSSVMYSIFWSLAMVCMVVVIFRMFSRNFVVRSKENAKYQAWWAKVRATFHGARNGGTRARTAKQNPTFEERRKYKYFLCKQCAQRLRVPRGKGKLMVTCTRCGNKFEMKS